MTDIYPVYVPTFKHKYNSNLDAFQRDINVNSLCQYIRTDDFISAIEGADKDVEIRDIIIPRLFDLGVIVNNSQTYFLGEKQCFFTTMEFKDSITIDTTFTSFLSNPNNLLILNYVTYNRSTCVFDVRCDYVENYKSINEPFLKEYTKTKRQYLIDKIVNK
jgi:hypothetical protein